VLLSQLPQLLNCLELLRVPFVEDLIALFEGKAYGVFDACYAYVISNIFTSLLCRNNVQGSQGR